MEEVTDNLNESRKKREVQHAKQKAKGGGWGEGGSSRLIQYSTLGRLQSTFAVLPRNVTLCSTLLLLLLLFVVVVVVISVVIDVDTLVVAVFVLKVVIYT